jgi:cytochrome c peroxidase
MSKFPFVLAWSIAVSLPLAGAAEEIDYKLLAKQAQKFAITEQTLPKRDPSNRFDGNPDAIALGRTFFFDSGLSANGTVSCATCHVSNGAIVPNESMPAGLGRKHRSVMPVAGAAFQDFFFWDGRADSLWAQALAPIEHPQEHDLTRTEAVAYVRQTYSQAISELKGNPLLAEADWEATTEPASPLGNSEERQAWAALDAREQKKIDLAFTEIGKFIAAYEATLLPPQTAWDVAVNMADTDATALQALPDSALRGFMLFQGKARCADCHLGPLFSDGDFHNTSLPQPHAGPLDLGRQAVVGDIARAEFGCRSITSDAPEGYCLKIDYLSLAMERAMGAFRTPSLRQVLQRKVLGHSGQISDLAQMLEHYNDAPAGMHGHLVGKDSLSELVPLKLTESELADLRDFLEQL